MNFFLFFQKFLYLVSIFRSSFYCCYLIFYYLPLFSLYIVLSLILTIVKTPLRLVRPSGYFKTNYLNTFTYGSYFSTDLRFFTGDLNKRKEELFSDPPSQGVSEKREWKVNVVVLSNIKLVLKDMDSHSNSENVFLRLLIVVLDRLNIGRPEPVQGDG